MLATRTSRHSIGANTKTLNGEITNGDLTSGGKSSCYRLFANSLWQPPCKILAHSFMFHRFRVQTLANVVHATVGEDRTPRPTHISVLLVFRT